MASEPPPGASRAKPRAASDVRPARILAVLSFSGFAFAVLSSAVTPALPVFQQSFDAGAGDVAWILTGFLLSSSVGTAIIGRLGDIHGRARVLFWTLIVLSAGTALAAIAPTLEVLIAARVIQGVAGGVFPLSFAIVREVFPAARIAGGIGLLSSMLGVGGAFGLIVGALIVDHLGVRWLFWIPFAVTVSAAVCTRLFIPASQVRAPGKVNWFAAVLMSTGICALLIAIARTSVWGWAGTPTLVLFGAGAALCALWIVVETRSRVPLIDMAMMRMRGVWTTNLAGFVLGAGMYGALLVLPQFAQLPTGAGIGFATSVLGAALLMLPSSITMGLIGSQAGRVARRFGSKLPFIVGSAVAASGFIFTVFAHDHRYQMLITATLLGIGMGLAFAALGNLVTQAVPPTQTGAASGMNAVMRTMGGAVGGQVAATFLASSVADGYPTISGFTDTYFLAAGLLLVAALVGGLIPNVGVAPRQASSGSTSPSTAVEVIVQDHRTVSRPSSLSTDYGGTMSEDVLIPGRPSSASSRATVASDHDEGDSP